MKKQNPKQKSVRFNTTIGDFIEAVYESAMEEYMDEVLARRITMQMLLRKLRQQPRINNFKQKPSSHNKQRNKKN